MIRCSICPLSFDNPDNLCSHIKKHHCGKAGEKTYRCTICERAAFTELWKYKRHLTNVCFQPTNSDIDDCEEIDNFEKNVMSEFEKMVDEKALAFVCKLAGNMNIPRSHTYEVLADFRDFYTSTLLKGFDQYVLPRVKEQQEEKSVVESFIQICKNPFRTVDSEEKLDSVLGKADLITSLHQFDIAKNFKDNPKYKPEYGALMPLVHQFKKFFELPDVFEITQKFTEEVSKETKISHFLNASLWKEKLKSFKSTDNVIPFHLHIDDTQVNNALGSHRAAGLETCCYYSFPSIPPQFSSRLENIFAAQLFRSGANKDYGNLACFCELIEELNKIAQEPVTLCINGKEIKVYFVLGLVLGDNKGLNDFAGFAKSHNATYFCRFCTLKKAQTKIRTTQDNSKMRNPENYAEDLSKNQPKLTGIVEDSVVNLILLCHATLCVGIDMMHDVFEGILHYNICEIILTFISKGYLTLDELNQLKSDFAYGEVETGNKSPPITAAKLESRKLLMSASEMHSFFHHFGLIVGGVIPKTDEAWKLYLKTMEFVDLIYLPSYSENDLSNLASTISKMNAMYKRLTNDTLKPKHHYVTHYPEMIRRFGPLNYISSMRYEAKHKMLKGYTKNTTSRKNLSYSLGRKLQYNFAHRILTNVGLNDRVVMGKNLYLRHPDMLSRLENPQSLQHLLNKNLRESTKVTINGIHFSTNLHIVFKREDKVTLYQIEKIIYASEEIENIYFICKEFGKVLFNKNYQCYEVNTSCLVDTMKSINAIEVLKERQHPVFIQVVVGSQNLRFRAKPF